MPSDPAPFNPAPDNPVLEGPAPGAPAIVKRVRVETTRFGALELRAEDIIRLPDGMPGFADVTEVVMLPVDDDGLFWWLQSVRDGSLAFLTVIPWAHFPDYVAEVPSADQELLAITDPDSAVVLCVLTMHETSPQWTANLLGPIVINSGSKVGRQVVLEQDLPTRAELRLPAS